MSKASEAVSAGTDRYTQSLGLLGRRPSVSARLAEVLGTLPNAIMKGMEEGEQKTLDEALIAQAVTGNYDPAAISSVPTWSAAGSAKKAQLSIQTAGLRENAERMNWAREDRKDVAEERERQRTRWSWETDDRPGQVVARETSRKRAQLDLEAAEAAKAEYQADAPLRAETRTAAFDKIRSDRAEEEIQALIRKLNVKKVGLGSYLDVARTVLPDVFGARDPKTYNGPSRASLLEDALRNEKLWFKMADAAPELVKELGWGPGRYSAEFQADMTELAMKLDMQDLDEKAAFSRTVDEVWGSSLKYVAAEAQAAAAEIVRDVIENQLVKGEKIPMKDAQGKDIFRPRGKMESGSDEMDFFSDLAAYSMKRAKELYVSNPEFERMLKPFGLDPAMVFAATVDEQARRQANQMTRMNQTAAPMSKTQLFNLYNGLAMDMFQATGYTDLKPDQQERVKQMASNMFKATQSGEGASLGAAISFEREHGIEAPK